MGHLQPMNIFLRQEIDRMQRVIYTVRTTLTDLKLAIDGTIIMNEVCSFCLVLQDYLCSGASKLLKTTFYDNHNICNMKMRIVME